MTSDVEVSMKERGVTPCKKTAPIDIHQFLLNAYGDRTVDVGTVRSDQGMLKQNCYQFHSNCIVVTMLVFLFSEIFQSFFTERYYLLFMFPIVLFTRGAGKVLYGPRPT